LHAAHWPLSAAQLLERGLDPFDDQQVRIACDTHHARIDAQRRAASTDSN
jgi:hypothetical protein